MNLLDAIARYTLAEETGFILGAIGLFLAIAGIIIALLSQKRQQALKIPISIFCTVILLSSILLIGNYYTVRMDDNLGVVNVPNVEGLS